MASTHGVRMPITEAIRRFCVTARICSPKGVKRMASISAAKTTSAKTTIHSRP